MVPLLEVAWAIALLWAITLVWWGIPTFIVARKLKLRGSGWALVPIGDLVTLGRCGDRGGWGAVWPSLTFWLLPAILAAASSPLVGQPRFQMGIISWLPLVILGTLWAVVCWYDGRSKWWGCLAAVPMLGCVGAWIIALRLEPLEEERASEPRAAATPARQQSVAEAGVVGAVASGKLEPTGPQSPQPTPARVPAERAQGLRPPAWLLSAGVVLAVVAAFLWLDKSQLHWYAAASTAPVTPTAPAATPTAEPDRVVGVIRKCDATSEGILSRIGREGCGIPSLTAEQRTRVVFNDRLEVTVRTGSGGSYVVTAPPTANVRVGDVWVTR